jgi:hypothetical protein
MGMGMEMGKELGMGMGKVMDQSQQLGRMVA